MTDDSLFGRPAGADDDDSAPARPAGAHRAPPTGDEGVRLITADEVAEIQRQPQAPPAAAPPGPAAARPEPVRPAAPRPAPEPATRPGATAPVAAGQPAPAGQSAPTAAQPTEGQGGVLRRIPAPAAQPASGDEPLPSGEVQLPHWTEPPTGEVPAVVAAEPPPSERWASGPRWRDEHDRWEDEGDLASDLAHEGGEDIGALSADRPTTGEMASFDDLATAGPIPRRAAGSTRGPRGGAPSGGGTGGGTGGRNMGQAIGVGVGLAIVGLVLARLGAPWMMVLVEIVVVLAAAEYFSTLRRAGLEPPTLLGLVAVAALPIATYARGESAIPMVLFLLVVFSMVWFLAGAGPGRPVRDIGTMLLAVLHVGVMGAFAALILRIGPLGGADVDQGVSILLLAVVAVVGYDVGGLFVGSRLGRTPLTDASPNKTREGLLGGLVVSVLAVLVAVLVPIFGLTTFSFGQALLFGIACAVAAFLGDLSESLIKRDLGVKDMGDLLPGHGGVLDRFDGMLFVLPTAYYMVLLLF